MLPAAYSRPAHSRRARGPMSIPGQRRGFGGAGFPSGRINQSGRRKSPHGAKFRRSMAGDRAHRRAGVVHQSASPNCRATGSRPTRPVAVEANATCTDFAGWQISTRGRNARPSSREQTGFDSSGDDDVVLNASLEGSCRSARNILRRFGKRRKFFQLHKKPAFHGGLPR